MTLTDAAPDAELQGHFEATIARNECRRRIGLRMRAGVAVGDMEMLAGRPAPAETRPFQPASRHSV